MQVETVVGSSDEDDVGVDTTVGIVACENGEGGVDCSDSPLGEASDRPLDASSFLGCNERWLQMFCTVMKVGYHISHT